MNGQQEPGMNMGASIPPPDLNGAQSLLSLTADPKAAQGRKSTEAAKAAASVLAATNV
jgi:hypothetical protein